MTLAEIIDVVQIARETGKPVNVILGDHGNAEGRMWWSHVCVAELMRLGWIEQAVDLHRQRPLVTACALIDVLPPLCKEPATIGGPVIYVLTPDQLPRFEGKGTCIVAGMNGSQHVHLPTARYWVRHFDQPVPSHTGAIEGFDTESFFACLLQSLDEFPPRAVLATPSKPYCAAGGKQTPAQELQAMLYRHSRQATEKATTLLSETVTANAHSKPSIDALAWAEKIERASELGSRLRGQGAASSLAPMMAALADAQSPHVADGFLQRAERLYRAAVDTEHAEYIALPGIASTLWKRANLRSGAAAEKMYDEADRVMARVKAGTKAGEARHLKNWGEMHADWAGRQSGDVEAVVLFDTALEKLEKSITIAPKDIPVRALYVHLVERSARKLGAAMPAHYFDAARHHCKWLIESAESWRGYFGLGIIEVYQNRAGSPDNLHRAIELVPQHKVALLSDWGTALMETGLLTEAYAYFTEAAAIDEKAFIPHVNMSAIRLRQARKGESTLDQAVHHAEIAESLSPGTGAYNLACTAGQRRDREGVEKWLNFSAEKGYLQNRSSIETDADFQSLTSEPWFAALLDRLTLS